MPFLNDDELADLNEKLEYAKRELNKANLKLYQANQELDKANEQLSVSDTNLEDSNVKIAQIQQELNTTKLQLENTNDTTNLNNELTETKLKLEQAYLQLNDSNLELNNLKETLNNTNITTDNTIGEELLEAKKLLNESNIELDKVKEELSVAHLKLNNTEEAVDTAVIVNNDDEALKRIKKSKTTQNIILSILTGIALAFAYYFYNNGSNTTLDINKIKQLEATRVIDSIGALNSNVTSTSNAFDKNIQALKNTIKNEKIYSVQIGAFSDNEYTLLSETLAGTASNLEMFKYSIGLFKTLQEAQDFRRELLKIGFKDAFVASYIDGIRQEIEHPN